MKYMTYPHLPIFAVTTQKHDFKEKGSLELVSNFFNIPKPHYCSHLHGDGLIFVESPNDPIL